MGYDLPKIPTNPRCSDHPTKSGRAKIFRPLLRQVIWSLDFRASPYTHLFTN